MTGITTKGAELKAREWVDHRDRQTRSKRWVLAHGLKQAAAQRQNILKTPFFGRLVPQNPNDEPAAVLLERIRAERAARDAKGVPRRRGTP